MADIIEVKGVRIRKDGLDPETVRYLERKLNRIRRHQRRERNPLHKLVQAFLPKDYQRRDAAARPAVAARPESEARRARVLVVGCGGGLEAIALGAVGMDIRLPAVRMAEELRAHAEGASADFAQACGGTLPFRDGTFDEIVSDNVAEHLPDAVLRSHLHDSVRVLRGGGAANGGRYLLSSPNRLFEDPPKHGHCSLHTYAEWEGLLLEAGFREVLTPHNRAGDLEDLEWKKVQEQRAAQRWLKIGIANQGLRIVTIVAVR